MRSRGGTEKRKGAFSGTKGDEAGGGGGGGKLCAGGQGAARGGAAPTESSKSPIALRPERPEENDTHLAEVQVLAKGERKF